MSPTLISDTRSVSDCVNRQDVRSVVRVQVFQWEMIVLLILRRNTEVNTNSEKRGELFHAVDYSPK